MCFRVQLQQQCITVWMSIYSGFSTRHQETKYNSLVENLILALKKRLIKFYRGEQADEHKFKLLIKKVYKKMALMERAKFLLPKHSTGIDDLISALEIQINLDTESDMSSVYSESFSLSIDNKRSTKEQFLKSRNMLQTKKHTLQNAFRADRSKELDISANKHITHLDMADEELITSLNHKLHPRSITFDLFSNHPPREGSSRVRLKELKQIRVVKDTKTTMPSPPKLQDFIPKKEQFFKEGNLFTQMRTEPKESRENHRSFRKQKFQKPEINVTEI